jgi:hypothetical protein
MSQPGTQFASSSLSFDRESHVTKSIARFTSRRQIEGVGQQEGHSFSALPIVSSACSALRGKLSLKKSRSWHEHIGDPTLADGTLDRLVHNAHRIEMRDDSMRKSNAR